MSFLMARLMAAQREQEEFERFVRLAPSLGLPDADRGRVEELLRQTPAHPVLQILRGRAPVRLTALDAREVANTLVATEYGREALDEFPLLSPKMLSAARGHGVDARILAAVEAELREQRA